ncbi:MAG TPA: DUF1326 domain-containing protein [Acidobacteriota bacterium]|nr:DUF1326 domain-containing protein [Acidobacteriota bacterium]
MRTLILVLSAIFLAFVPFAVAGDASISGDYVEVRTADVYTGPCFANGEMNLTGKEAILAWRINQGLWQGVALDGLSVVAVVKSNSTLGDPFAPDPTTRAVLIVDEKANQAQHDALVDLARSLAPDLTTQVIAIKTAPVHLEMIAQSGFAEVKAGDFAEIKTRALHHHDTICGNESVYYPPLTELASSQPAYTVVHRYEGDELNGTWSSPAKRSAFVGTFVR